MSILSHKVQKSMSILSRIVNLTEASPYHLYVDTPILTLPSTKSPALLPKLLSGVMMVDGVCVWLGTQ